MGLFQRLWKGASPVGERDASSPGPPGETAAEGADLIRALIQEIRLLRETLGDRRIPAPVASRGRRTGRGRSRGGPEEPAAREGGSFSSRGSQRGQPRPVPEDAPTGLLVDYLKSRKVVVYEGGEDSVPNQAFEHLSRHIGQHFTLVAPFYERVKRIVATGRGGRIDLEGFSEHERSAAVQLGTLLHRHGMLKDFYYHRSPRKQLRVIPTSDGGTAQFLTGGWLEIYVAWLLSRRFKASLPPPSFQILSNVKGTLPDQREFEADLMACAGGRLFWVECKTGQWQDYSARFRGLVKTFGCDRSRAGLLLLRPPDSRTRARATDMLDMTVLALEEAEGFIDRFLESIGTTPPPPTALDGGLLEDGAASRARPPRQGRPRPLRQGSPPARQGTVSEETEGDAPVSRRRRGRRGGRGRRRSTGAERAGAASEARTETPPKVEPARKEAPLAGGSLESPPVKPARPVSPFRSPDSGGKPTPVPGKPEPSGSNGRPGLVSKPQETLKTEEPLPSSLRRRRRRRRRPDGEPVPVEKEAVEGGEAVRKPQVPAEKPAPKADAPKAEVPKANAPKAKPPKAERPKAERPKAERPKAAPPAAAREKPSGRPKASVTIAPDLQAMMARIPKKTPEEETGPGDSGKEG